MNSSVRLKRPLVLLVALLMLGGLALTAPAWAEGGNSEGEAGWQAFLAQVWVGTDGLALLFGSALAMQVLLRRRPTMRGSLRFMHLTVAGTAAVILGWQWVIQRPQFVSFVYLLMGWSLIVVVQPLLVGGLSLITPEEGSDS